MIRTNNRQIKAKCISFVYQKGGTGKTTACLNIAGWLAKLHQKVLIVDLDPQANATTGLGVDTNTLDATAAEVLVGKKEIRESILETKTGIFLLPANAGLLLVDHELMKMYNPIYILEKKVRQVGALFDFILIDVSPGSTLLMMNAIVASRNVIAPIDAGIFSYETLSLFKEIIDAVETELNLPINVALTLLKTFSPSLIHLFFTWQLKKEIGKYLIRNDLTNGNILTMPFSSKVCFAQMKGLPISHYAPYSRIGKKYKQIARKILNGQIYLTK